MACAGSKKRILARLIAFKIGLESKLQLSIANKLFNKNQKRPMTLGQPKLPSLKEQELHFVAHWPYAPWCQACVASRAKADKAYIRGKEAGTVKECHRARLLLRLRGEGKIKRRLTRFKSGRISSAHASSWPRVKQTKATHVVPVQSKGAASLKRIMEEVIGFALDNASRDA